MDKMYAKLQELTNSGYLIWNWIGNYCVAIKEIDGHDRWVLLKLEDSHWIIITQ